MVELLEKGFSFAGLLEFEVSIVIKVGLVTVFFVEFDRHFEDTLSDFLFVKANQTAFVEFTSVYLANILFLFGSDGNQSFIYDFLCLFDIFLKISVIVIYLLFTQFSFLYNLFM